MFLFTTTGLSLLANFFYINHPFVDMREDPSSASKVVSQAVFSERISVEKEESGWSYIVSSDGYKGWVPSETFVSCEKPYEGSAEISRLMAHLYGLKDTEYGPIKTLPYGAKLQVLDGTGVRFTKIALPDGQEAYIQNGDIASESPLQKKEDLVSFSKRFLGLPYTWGGRSSFGYDCSGFVQMLYNKIGISLQRDSKQQVCDDRFQTIAIHDLEPGDLVFFGKSEGRIMHVGMYLGEGSFIHATSRECLPWIRISKLTDSEWCGSEDAYYPFRTARQMTE